MISENTIETSPSDGSNEGDSSPFKFNFKTLSSLLRVFGAGVLVSSLSLFLFQGWTGSEDIYRFATLIGFSGLLTVAGFVCARLINENISARLFLGIALLSVIVNFAVAGGLIYSGMQSVLVSTTLPEFARWHIGSGISVSLLGLASIVVLTPVSIIAFRALARKSSGTLFKLFVATNALLLVPVRDSDSIVVVGAVLAVIVIRQLIKLGRDDASLSTVEGRFAKALVFAPVLVLMGRSLFFYDPGSFAFAILSGLVFVILRQIGLALSPRSTTSKALGVVSAPIAFVTATMCTNVLAQAWPSASPIFIPVFCVIFVAMLGELSLRIGGAGTALRKFAALTLAVGIALNLFLYASFPLAIFTMAVGLLVLGYGYSAEQKIVFAAGITTVGIGFVYQLWLATTLFDFGNWGTLATLGTLTILAASVIERYGLGLKNRLINWRSKMDGWQS